MRAIRLHYQKHGVTGIQLSLPFDVPRDVILKTAQRMGIKSDVKGGRKHGDPRQVKEREPKHKRDEFFPLLTGWYHLTEPGALAWRV